MEAIFIKNRFNYEVRFQLIDTMTNKDLAHFLHSLLIRGLVLLYGHDNKLTLNHVTMGQLEKAREKLKLAHVNVRVSLYDKDTAVDLEYMPQSAPRNMPLEVSIARMNHAELGRKAHDLNLRDYVFKTYLNNNLVCVSFEVV